MTTWTCDHCDALIDSDEDPDCFVEVGLGKFGETICEPCRERMWDRQQERAMEEAP